MKHRNINNTDCSKNICDTRCFSAGIPSSSGVGILCEQQEGWILPQWQHPCQIQILWYWQIRIGDSCTPLKVAACQWQHQSSDCCLSPRKLPVRHIRWRGAAHVSQPRRGLCDEHALRPLQRSGRPARTRPGRSQATLTIPPCAFFPPQASCMAPWPWNWVVRLPSPVRKQATVLSWSSDWRYSFVLLLKSRLQLLLWITFVYIWIPIFLEICCVTAILRILRTSLLSFFLFISHSQTYLSPTDEYKLEHEIIQLTVITVDRVVKLCAWNLSFWIPTLLNSFVPPQALPWQQWQR